MIIKGNEHDNAGNLARYLLTAKENETPFVMELRDTASDDLTDTLTDWEAIGRCKSKGEKILYHAHIRLCDGETLHETQWLKMIDELEQQLGFTNCPRAIIGHDNTEKGFHVHIVWSRLDPTKKPLVQLGNDHEKHHRIARASEKEFGLKPAVEPGKEREPRRGKRLSDREIRALKDRGINKDKLLKTVRAAWDGTDSGEEMRAMLGALGVEIVPGKSRDWVVEYKGLKMNPVRLLDDVNEAKFRDRMKDVDLEQAKEQAREKSPAEAVFGRKARATMQGQFNGTVANDQAERPPKTGFRTKKHSAPQPRLKRKMWYGDPGI